MRTKILSFSLVFAGLAACSDTGVDPQMAETVLNEDVAVVTGAAVVEDLEVMSTVFPAASGAPALAGILGYSRSRTVTFYDAQDVEQEGYDPLTTASIHTILTVEGEVSRDGYEWSLSRSRDMTVTGLEGDETERTWNGTGEEDRSRARFSASGDMRSYEMSGTLMVDDVVRGVPRAEYPYPLSGTITRNVTIEVTNGPRGDETITRSVVVTFDGTRYPELAVNGDIFELDLDATGPRRIRRP